MELQHFTKNGNQYIMKKQYIFGLIVSFGMAAFAIVGIWINEIIMVWIFGILAVLCFISIWMKHVVIDLDKNEITVKVGLINPVVHIPLKDFLNFELVRITQYLITTNTCLNVYYLKNGEEKAAMIAQGFTKRSMQNLVNEIDEIMRLNEHSR
jgi:hypothetical protein